jgi:TolA-binding protein
MRQLLALAATAFSLTLAGSHWCPSAALAQEAVAVRLTPSAAVNPQLGDELLRLSDRIASLERLVSQLVARQDEGQRSAAQLASEFARFKTDVESRVDAIELQAASASALVSARASTSTSTSTVVMAVPYADEVPSAVAVAVVPAPVDRFSQGLAFAVRQDWSQAELAFDTFIANNPGDERVPAARYQLGLAYLSQNQPAQAARMFLDLFETGAAAAFGADNLFALARALQALDPENAEQFCTVYSEIETSYGEALTPGQREILLDRRLAGACTG